MTTVLDCIERIPSKLKAIYDEQESRFQKLALYIKERNIEHVCFIASGTSYNSAFTTRLFFEELQLSVSYVYPNIFVNYTKHYHENTLYVVISQGGATKLVYDALLLVKEKGCANCSITEKLDAPIAKAADIALPMGSDDEEFMYRTLGYSTTVATCYMLGITLAQVKGTCEREMVEAYRNDFQKMIQHLPSLKQLALDWYEQHRFSLMHKDHMMFAATGDLWPVVQEADIKFMEMIPAITRSFELEEFIHGPQNAFDATSAYFLLGCKGQDEEKINAISSFLKHEIGFCCVVGDCGNDARDLIFEPVSTHFKPLEYITLMQVLAYKLADDHGRDLGRGVNTVVNKYIKKTL